MVGIIFNHDMRDDPYNQIAVNKAFKQLDAFLNEINEKGHISFGVRRDVFFHEDTDEYIVVQHTCAFTTEQKKRLAEIVNEALTLKKSAYPNEKPNKVIVFQQINAEDCYCF